MLDRYAGGGRVQPYIKAGAGDGHAALGRVDHERPAAVVGDDEHRLTGVQLNVPPPRAEIDLQLRTAVERQLRAVRQFDLAALTEGSL
ncbi:hypothetical protein D3C79_849760 [compost metagenome]